LQKRQPRLDPKRLVFIDQTSVSTTISRPHGRALQEERLVQKVPHGNWKTVTFIAALRHDRVTASFMLEGPMTGEMLKAYTEQFLVPTLKRGDIVFMDNVSVHKVDGIEEAIEAHGANPFYLPAYSSDLNPIEQLHRVPSRQPQQPGHCVPGQLKEISHRVIINRFAGDRQPFCVYGRDNRTSQKTVVTC
jgi:DDE superfamily endonuclease